MLKDSGKREMRFNSRNLIFIIAVVIIIFIFRSNRMRGSANLEVDVSTQEMTGVQAENDFSETNPVKIED